MLTIPVWGYRSGSSEPAAGLSALYTETSELSLAKSLGRIETSMDHSRNFPRVSGWFEKLRAKEIQVATDERGSDHASAKLSAKIAGATGELVSPIPRLKIPIVSNEKGFEPCIHCNVGIIVSLMARKRQTLDERFFT